MQRTSVMRVGVDYWPAVTHAPGVGRYVRELVRALAQRPDLLELRLLDVGPSPRVMAEPALGLEGRDVRRLKLKAPRKVLAWGARLGLGADRWLGGCDVFHAVSPSEPVSSRALRTCAVSEWPAPEMERQAARALQACAAVFTFSRYAAEQLCTRLELDPQRVHALPVGCEHWRRTLEREPPLDQPPTVLVLGRVDERRNPLAVLRACEQLAADGVELRLRYVGRRGDSYDALRAYATRSPLSSRVQFDSEPQEHDLPSLVARATVLVHLSDGELTPVTPLEALATGCDVVLTRAPAFVEALGPAGRWIDAPAPATSPQQLAREIAAAIAERGDEFARRSRQAVAAAYSWRRHAELAAHIWRELVAQR
ncbi:MAG: glycosyltransferase [Planctomycetes bacterium]|nr:glycosyltransferase [Planctomycetota bacterium]